MLYNQNQGVIAKLQQVVEERFKFKVEVFENQNIGTRFRVSDFGGNVFLRCQYDSITFTVAREGNAFTVSAITFYKADGCRDERLKSFPAYSVIDGRVIEVERTPLPAQPFRYMTATRLTRIIILEILSTLENGLSVPLHSIESLVVERYEQYLNAFDPNEGTYSAENLKSIGLKIFDALITMGYSRGGSDENPRLVPC